MSIIVRGIWQSALGILGGICLLYLYVPTAVANIDTSSCVAGIYIITQKYENPAGSGHWFHYVAHNGSQSPYSCPRNSEGNITTHHGARRCVKCTQPCTPSWRNSGSCDKTCGPGLQKQKNGCGGTRNVACNNGACPTCGPAHRESYKQTAKVVTAGRCDPSSVMSDWVNNSEVASNGGLAWTWKCSRTSSTVDCRAYKLGECEDAIMQPYSTRASSCKEGTFNSVKLVPTLVEGVLKDTLLWKCGTGEHADRHVGSFSSNAPGSGALVGKDDYGPVEGGVECRCVPDYNYTCEATEVFIGNCANRCGEEISEIYQAYKKDNSCFINEDPIKIDKTEYNIATAGKHCTNQPAWCAPCGAQDSEGGSYHETAY